MEKKESKIKSNVATGMSTAAGATIGAVAGGTISQSAFAAEEPQSVQEPESHPNRPTGNQEQAGQPVSPTLELQSESTLQPGVPIPESPEPELQPEPESVTPEPVPDTEPEVLVINSQTVTNDDGSQMDVAVLSVDGTPAVIVDVDQDGIVDVIAVDENGSGTLEENEIFTEISIDGNNDGIIQPQEVHAIAELEIMMPQVEEPYTEPGDLAYSDIDSDAPDYINDANVGDYMA